MPLCLAPWANLDINPQGNIAPCCKYQFHDKKFNLATHDLKEYFSSNFLTQLKEELSRDQWPNGCIRCKIEEDNNIASMRQLNHAKWQNNFNGGSVVTASIAFGNTCNLKCITCNPYVSSTWHREYKKIYHHDYKPMKFARKNLLNSIIEYVPNLIHLDIPGGEPFLNEVDQQLELLQHYVDKGTAQKISLHYTTNATVWPKDVWWDLWKNFAEIEIQCSIDGIGKKCEYIRFPAKWPNVSRNVMRYNRIQLPNFKLSLSHTVSAYNIFYLDEFVSWCYNTNLPEPWLGNVYTPKHMRPTVWPNKQIIIDKLKQSKHTIIASWIHMLETCDDSQYYAMFKQKLLEHDQYRGISFFDTFPELQQLLN